MQKTLGLTAALFVAVLSTYCYATELPPLDRPVTVLQDKRTRVFWSTNINPDCSPLGETVVRINKPAKNGKVEVEDGEGHTSFKPDVQRYKCNEKLLPGKSVFYTPAPGFTGTDQAELEYFMGTGDARKLRLKITVK
ncbi:MAG: hypothetical protein ACO1NY_10195 [Pseudorhodoplanes sp.]